MTPGDSVDRDGCGHEQIWSQTQGSISPMRSPQPTLRGPGICDSCDGYSEVPSGFRPRRYISTGTDRQPTSLTSAGLCAAAAGTSGLRPSAARAIPQCAHLLLVISSRNMDRNVHPGPPPCPWPCCRETKTRPVRGDQASHAVLGTVYSRALSAASRHPRSSNSNSSSRFCSSGLRAGEADGTDADVRMRSLDAFEPAVDANGRSSDRWLPVYNTKDHSDVDAVVGRMRWHGRL
ncbi:hypothetical protein C8Q80DRAFT_1178335 [Daedaleopsis nitida]|nr:hypothetical protein C8Q80DRAFT_1178335 [Daedaleopsis nitida]